MVEVQAALAWVLLIGYWIVYPIWLLLLCIWFIVAQLYRPLAFLLLPLVYLCRFLATCIALLFTAAARLETIYIFLGVAALVGLFGGLFIRSIYGVLYKLLRLDARPAPKLRTAKQYREEKRKQKLQADQSLSSRHPSPGPLSSGSLSFSDGAYRGNKRLGLSRQIIAEDDSEF